MLNSDYREMLSVLLENSVNFLVVGAYAMGAHGFVRATGDIDIFVKPDKNNAQRVYAALEKFGAPMENVSSGDFEHPGTIFQIGVAPRRIDIITEIDGLTYEQAAQDKAQFDIEGLSVPVISKKNLIINKRASGREKDRLDAEALSR